MEREQLFRALRTTLIDIIINYITKTLARQCLLIVVDVSIDENLKDTQTPGGRQVLCPSPDGDDVLKFYI
jgi:hypothetical protein